jgi:hypothetical protein
MKVLRHGCHIIECDSCNETIESELGELWESFWPRAKLQGWKTKKIGGRNGEWVHGCPKHEA